MSYKQEHEAKYWNCLDTEGKVTRHMYVATLLLLEKYIKARNFSSPDEIKEDLSQLLYESHKKAQEDYINDEISTLLDDSVLLGFSKLRNEVTN